MPNHPFKKITDKLMPNIQGINPVASVNNMYAALSPKNRLARAQSGADSGTAHTDYISRYVGRHQYLNMYVRGNKK